MLNLCRKNIVLQSSPISFRLILPEELKLNRRQYEITDSRVDLAIRLNREVRINTDHILDPNNKDVCFAVTFEYHNTIKKNPDWQLTSTDIIVTNGVDYFIAIRSLGSSGLTFDSILKQEIDASVEQFVRTLR